MDTFQSRSTCIFMYSSTTHIIADQEPGMIHICLSVFVLFSLFCMTVDGYGTGSCKVTPRLV